MAIMISASMTFAQEVGSSSTPGGSTSVIGVGVVKNNCLCPSNGYITGDWRWKKFINNAWQYVYSGGSKFYYYYIPAYGTIESSIVQSGYMVDDVHLYIQPNTGSSLGLNSQWLNIHGNIIRPSGCVPAGTWYNCPMDTD